LLGFFLFSVVFLVASSDFQVLAREKRRVLEGSGGVLFNARSVSLDWSFSNRNLLSAVVGLFWSDLVIF
jgi:hypothetical protein